MKTERFVTPGLRIEYQWDRWNGALWLAWKPHVSMCFRDTKELIRFCAWPVKTPTGDLLRGWVRGLVDQQPAIDAPQPAQPLSDELLATGFGPECHDVDNDNTRTVI